MGRARRGRPAWVSRLWQDGEEPRRGAQSACLGEASCRNAIPRAMQQEILLEEREWQVEIEAAPKLGVLPRGCPLCCVQASSKDTLGHLVQHLIEDHGVKPAALPALLAMLN